MSDICRKYLASYMIDAWKRAEDQNLEIDVVRDCISESPYVTLTFNGASHHFSFGSTPFNTDQTNEFVNDKWALYEACRDLFHCPYSEAVRKASTQTDEEVHRDLLDKIHNPDHIFAFPLILKPNNGSLGKNVFLAKNSDQLLNAIKHIRNTENDGEYLLTQQYLGDEQGAFSEIRAICLDGKSKIVFQRSTTQNIPENTMDPGQWPGLVHTELRTPEVISQIDEIALYLHTEHGVSYAAFDLKLDRDGAIWLLEGNSSPMGLHRAEKELPNGTPLLHALTDSMLRKIVESSYHMPETAEECVLSV